MMHLFDMQGLPAFIAYFSVGAVLLSVFLAAYMRLTKHDEVALVRAGNVSAAIAFGATLLGLALPIASAIANTVTLAAAAAWAFIGCLVQLGAYGIARLVVPDLSARIERDERAAALLAAAVALGAAMLNAAAMTY